MALKDCHVRVLLTLLALMKSDLGLRLRQGSKKCYLFSRILTRGLDDGGKCFILCIKRAFSMCVTDKKRFVIAMIQSTRPQN